MKLDFFSFVIFCLVCVLCFLGLVFCSFDNLSDLFLASCLSLVFLCIVYFLIYLDY